MLAGQTHAAMNRVAWLSYALLALAHGRIYERCELARDLLSFGVDPEDVATWVCIAYHESRFDTSANNPFSGDHGIFQISEIFWCGPGKACDISCSALRDEDISNDLQCALQIHEEHTRLQGNGFLAWVVYPQHCKHNTKKYLVDCDISAKNYVPITRPRFFMYENRYFPSNDYHAHNVEDLLPPYLAIGDIIRANYGKVLDLSKNRVDWYNYKINNIDDLKLLTSFIKPKQQVTEPLTTPETKETTEYIPPVVPWRTIETNQFRRKNLLNPEATTQSTTQKVYSTVATKNTTRKLPISITESRTSTVAPTTLILPPSKLTVTQPTTQSTTTTAEIFKSTFTSRVTYRWRPTITPKPFFLTTFKEPVSTSKAITSERSTAAIRETGSSQAVINISTNTVRTPTTGRYTPPRLSTVTNTSPRPTSTVLYTTTSPPTNVIPLASKPTRTTPAEVKTTSKTTRKPDADFSRYTFTSRIASTTTTTTATTKSQQIIQTTTSSSTESSKATPTTTTRTPRPTQSIFDLYLNPTKPPKISLSRFLLVSNPFSIKIFDNGTTTPAPPLTRYRPKTSQHIRIDDKIDKLT